MAKWHKLCQLTMPTHLWECLREISQKFNKLLQFIHVFFLINFTCNYNFDKIFFQDVLIKENGNQTDQNTFVYLSSVLP